MGCRETARCRSVGTGRERRIWQRRGTRGTGMESVARPSSPMLGKVEATTSHSPTTRLFLCRWRPSGHLERVGRLKKGKAVS